MAMFWEFFTFELKFRFKSISTYIYFLLWFTFSFLCVASESFGPIGNSNGKILLNGPYSNSYNDIGISFFGVIVIAAMFGTSILRDFQRDTIQILFTKPISKFAYLGGRWAGSFVATVFAFSGLVFGTMAGSSVPWADHTRLASGHIWWYFQPFLYFVVPQIFFLGSLFFCVAALSRRIIVVYLQGVALFAAYLILYVSVTATNKLDRTWSSIFDPLGINLMEGVTRYWTVAERNTQLVHWSGIFLTNRLLWLGVGLAALVVNFEMFPMSAELLAARRTSLRAKEARADEEAEQKARPRFGVSLPPVKQVFDFATIRSQLWSLTRLRFSGISRAVVFWAIVLIMIVNTLLSAYFAGESNEVYVWPVTYLMVQVLQGSSFLFLFIISTMYAGELVWRERDV